jgi:hypothetical protein
MGIVDRDLDQVMKTLNQIEVGDSLNGVAVFARVLAFEHSQGVGNEELPMIV